MIPVGFEAVQDKKPYVKMLLYGPPGAGKTRFCADAPKPWWIDFENSTETLRHWDQFKDIPVKTPKNVEDVLKAVRAAVVSNECETIILDSMTTAHDRFMRDRIEEIVQKKPTRDKYEFYEQDYKYATQVFTDIFDTLTTAPINVVMIFHERKIINNETGVVEGIFPDVTPRLQQAVTRLVNVVGYLESTISMAKKETTRLLYLNRTPKIEAKNRLNIQDLYLTNPDWNKLYS